MNRPSFPSLILLIVVFTCGYGTAKWLAPGQTTAEVSAPAQPTPVFAPEISIAAPGIPVPVSPSEIRMAIEDQKALVEENRRKLEEMNPDVASLEERYRRAAGIVRKFSQPDLPESALMELTAAIGGADWMPGAMSEYLGTQREQEAISGRYLQKHPRVAAVEERLTELGNKLTAEAGRVFKEAETLSKTLEKSLPDARKRAAAALRHPEQLQPLEQNLRDSEERLETLRSQLEEKSGVREK